MFPLNTVSLIILLSLGALSFLAGWVTSGWKHNSDEKEELVGDVSDRDRQIKDLTSDLNEVIDTASRAAINVQSRLDGMDKVVEERNNGLAILTKRTQELGNEIAKLEPTGCVFPPAYRRMYFQIGEEANDSRNRLYGTTGTSAD